MTNLRIYVDFVPPPDALDLLRRGTAGHELVFSQRPASSVLSGAEPDPQFAGVDVAFGQPDPRAVADVPQLKWIHVSTSGMTRYDNPDFRSLVAARNIAVSNSATVYREACATHALSFMLAQARNLPLALETRAGSGTSAWKELRGSCVPLQGQTVLILGYGAIGRRLTELLHPFDVKVIGLRRKPRGDEGVPVIGEDRLAHVLANEADHVVNILPDSAQTRRFFDGARFLQLKHGAVFYNIGRGATVDQDALLDVLRAQHIRAAWLDVTEPEPLPDDHPLRAEPNCYITPHVAGGHADEAGTLVRHFLNNLDRFVRGEAMLDRVS